MKTSRFTEQQIAMILKQLEDGLGVDDVCRKAGVSQQTYYPWRKNYGGLMPSEAKRLKQLEEENRRLKEMSLTCLWIRQCYRTCCQKAVRPARARGIVDYLQGAFGASIQQACRCISLQKSSYFKKPRRPSQAALKQRIKEISQTRVR